MSERDEPPTFIPPESVDPATGVFSLPFEVNMLGYSRMTKGCCWSVDGLTVFGPERVQLTMPRAHSNVPEPLRARGIDQEEYAAMLDDVKAAMANAAPYASPWCLAPLAFTIVFAPLVVCCLCSVTCDEERQHDRTTDFVEAGIKERASTWRTKYGVETKILRRVKWTRPDMPAEDALYGFKSMNLRASEWSGSVLTFTPPSPERMTIA